MRDISSVEGGVSDRSVVEEVSNRSAVEGGVRDISSVERGCE